MATEATMHQATNLIAHKVLCRPGFVLQFSRPRTSKGYFKYLREAPIRFGFHSNLACCYDRQPMIFINFGPPHFPEASPREEEGTAGDLRPSPGEIRVSGTADLDPGPPGTRVYPGSRLPPEKSSTKLFVGYVAVPGRFFFDNRKAANSTLRPV
jgi:hypothetical protein